MKRLLAALAILAVLFAAIVAFIAANAANRPEGPTERWLSAISRDTDVGAIAKFGDIDAAGDLLGFAITGGGTTDRKHLDRFEVGPASVDGDTATVPVRVWAHDSAVPTQWTLELQLESGAWKVTGALPSQAPIVFPSDGGSTYGTSPTTLVVITLIVGVVVFVVALTLVRIGGARPLHQR